MNYDQFSTAVMNSIDTICYMSDTETYELLYLNKRAMTAFGTVDSDYYGKKCYEVLQGRSSPCPFCTNHLISVGEPYEWEHYNPLLNQFYQLQDFLIDVNDRKVRLEFATDITKSKLKVEALETNLDTQKTLVSCIQTLTDNVEIDDAINNLLANIGTYYNAERAYIFEFDHANNEINNTYEWCKNSTKAAITELQNLPMEVVSRWVNVFEEKGELCITSLDDEICKDDDEFKILASQGVKSLMAVPLTSIDGEIMGFIGVDDPAKQLKNVSLLSSISLFILNDLSKRRMYEKLEHLNYTDVLTGLFNRRKYTEKLRELEEFPPRQLGIIFADINGLRPINETYGQAHGDNLIMKNALVLKKIFGKNVYRLGGDEFVIFCQNVSEETFEDLIQELRKQITGNVNCNLAFGSVHKTGRINLVKEIIYAEEIMNIEKQSYYKSCSESGVFYKTGIVKTLLDEIASNKFVVYLQAKVQLSTGKIVGAEALIRKLGDDGKIIPPDKFIPIYEKEKIIRHIDLYVAEVICKTMRKWIDEGNPLKISINLSRITLLEHGIINELTQLCKKYDIPKKYFDLEVTESNNKIDNVNLTKKVMEAQQSGFSVSLDDFGAEYSNLLMLTLMDFSQIKLDKSLIEKLCVDEKSKTVVEYAIKMCNQLNIEDSLAEGIETEEQRAVLEEIECRSGQGYLFSRPIPIDDFYEILKKQRENEKNK